MSKAKRTAVVLAALALVVAAFAWVRYDRARLGVPDFMVWRAVSGTAHGGQRIATGGARIYYETYGSGPPVLVLHGGFGILESMHNQITDLAHDHLVIAPDSRGHGRSTDGPGPLHYSQMADDMIALMDHLHIARADIVGWSDGGVIGLDMAMRYPNRVGRLAIFGANYDAAGLVDLEPIPPQSPLYRDVRNVYRHFSPTPDHWPVFAAKVEAMWAGEPHYSLADLARIRGPVLVMAGEHDMIRRQHTDALARAIPGAREIIFPGADHMAPLEEPGPVEAAIRAFLSAGQRNGSSMPVRAA